MPFFRKVERTVRIGVGIKAASLRKILGEDLLALVPAFQWRQADPFAPFVWKVFDHSLGAYPCPQILATPFRQPTRLLTPMPFTSSEGAGEELSRRDWRE